MNGQRWKFEREAGKRISGRGVTSLGRSLALDLKHAREALVTIAAHLDGIDPDTAPHRRADALMAALSDAGLLVRLLEQAGRR